ncbi:MAG: hypothetical protein K9J27_11465 [Bacteroidales bacterium]|nr:hypothetical protein [Bacteroidales bacterium]
MKKFKLLFPVLIALGLFNTGCEETDDFLPNENSDPRDEFIGKWNCNETELKSTEDFTVTIQKDPDNSSQVLLQNFALLGQNKYPYGLITGDKITLPEQETGNVTIKDASGELVDENKIEWEYTLFDGADENKYVATFTRIE